MPRPFNQTFLSLYRKKPFADDDRVNLRHFVEALRREFVGPTATAIDFETEADSVYDAVWPTTASGADLDEWGAVLNIERCPTEPDDNWGVEFFGPATDYINVPYAASLDVTTQLTVDMRFRIDALPASRIIYSRTNAEQEIWILATGAVQWYPRPAVIATSGAGAVVPGTWYHIRCIYDNLSGAEVYLGQAGGVFTLIAVAAAGGLMTAGAWPIRIGQRWSGTNPMDGVVDEIRAVAGVIPTVGGVTEVPRCLEVEAGTCFLLPCDEGTGAVAADISPNANDGALQGNAGWYAMLTTGWPGYRARLLAQLRLANDCLTVQAVMNAVNTIGAGYTPVITAVRVHEYYKGHYGTGGPDYGRRADGPVGGPATADECLGEIHGLDDHDYLTFAVELNRSPSVAEAWELVNGDGVNPGIYEIKPAHTRGHVITDMGLPNPPRYRMHSWAYSRGLAPMSWEDNFNRLPVFLGVGDYYNVVVGVGGGWSYSGVAPFTLIGVAAANAALADVIVPRQDLPDYKVVVDEYNVYVYAVARFASMGMPTVNDFAGFVFRYQDATDAFYAVVFRDNGVAWEYSIQRFTGAAWVVEKAWAVTGVDMSAWREIEMWVRDESRFTLRIDGAVIINEHDVGPDIIAPGEFGFVTAQVDVDVEVDEWRYW